jgi:hypothetical protein
MFPLLLLALTGSGVAPGPAVSTPDQIVARAGEITRAAGSAHVVISYSGSAVLSGAVNLSAGTPVLDKPTQEIILPSAVYQPIQPHEARLLGIADKRWVRTDVHVPLLGDPFLSDLDAFFGVLKRAREAQFVGDGEDRGTPVRRYSARLGTDAFLAVNPPSLEDWDKAGNSHPVRTAEYFADYFPWADDGQLLVLAVDSAGRIRRADLDLPSERLTVQFDHYGITVDASSPAAEGVVPSTEYESLKSEYCSNPIRSMPPRKPPCQ